MRVGCDLVKISRFKKLLVKPHFLSANFTEAEQKYISGKINAGQAQTLAGIFAVKEAFLKALGLGVLNGLSLREIEISHFEGGKPKIQVSLAAVSKFGAVENIDVSVSHDGDYAMAVVILD